MVLGPAWTRGEIEKPAGTRSMGSYSVLFYTPEQQARLGVDEQGNKQQAVPQVAAPTVRVVSQTMTGAAPAPVPAPAKCGAIGPAWTRGEIEKPAGTKNMGTYTIGVYTEEQQARLGVDEFGQKRIMSTAATISSGSAAATPITSLQSGARLHALGPAWTRGEIEKPAGTKNMGTYSILVYTAEQQARLGVDEQGNKRPTSPITRGVSSPTFSQTRSLGPAWTRGEIEKPAGTKDMGSFKVLVYTEEQQQRLGVDENGTKKRGILSPPSSPLLSATRSSGPNGGACGLVGPAWTRGEIEKPALVKDMGTWKALVYSEEQQKRLGVDEQGNKRMAASTSIPARQVLSATSVGSSNTAQTKALGPAWTRGEIEKPALTKDMGSYKILVYSEEQQRRLGVDEYGKKLTDTQASASAAAAPGSNGAAACRAIGPAWTRGEIEKPAVTKDMGTYKILVYSEEQQRRLGVDETGRKREGTAGAVGGQTVVKKVIATGAAPKAGGCRAIGPAWTRGEIEKPQGTKNMGTWTALVYTQEQQARLGVDEQGNKVASPPKGPTGPPGDLEKPKGVKDMGLHSIGVYTAEQQARLGVDERGRPKEKDANTAPPPMAAMGPGAKEIEKPKGIKDMGAFAVGVYTEEQQARLGVDERGRKL
mmetsp:Transcript_63054/g.133097  ORF Transcript_63054/g.133097 Transcript_63054/m.133097 type:complete len:648 (+) Transcript_63054:139-2082(+)